MNPEQDSKLAAALDAELKALPFAPAPAALAPAVMAMVGARMRLPWWQRAWWDWPLVAKVAFLILTVAVAGLMGGGTLLLGDNAAEYSADLVDRVTLLGVLLDVLAPLGAAAGLVWQKLAQPLMVYALAGFGVLYLMCLGMGTACYRFALKRV